MKSFFHILKNYPHSETDESINMNKGGIGLSGVIFIFFIIALLFFIGAFHYLKLVQQSASYPPKKQLKQKVAVLASAGFISLVIGIILLSFS